MVIHCHQMEHTMPRTGCIWPNWFHGTLKTTQAIAKTISDTRQMDHKAHNAEDSTCSIYFYE